MTTLKMKGSGEIITVPQKKCPKNETSSRNSSKRDFSNSTRGQLSCILTSKKVAKNVSAATCIISDEHVSSAVVFDGSLRNFEGSNSKKPLGCDPSEQHTSARSDISSEVKLPLVGDKNKLDTRRALEKNLNSSENGLSSITHDTQTDSSCSNSCVTHPVCQETSAEAKTFTQQNLSSCAFAPISFTSSMEDPVTSSVASGVDGQMAQNSVDNVKASVSTKVSGVIKDQNFSADNTLDPSIWSHQLWKNLDAPNDNRTSFTRLDHALGAPNNGAREIRQYLNNHPDKVYGGLDFSGNHGENNCSAAKNKESCSCIQYDSFDNYLPKGEEVLHRQSSTSEYRSLSTSQQESEEMDPGKSLNGSLELPACSPKCEIDQKTAVVTILNLNEDISQYDDPKQSDGESIPSIKAIRVVAKSGVPLPLSMTMSSLKFEGKLGWRGAAATSAFRPASFPRGSDWNTSSTCKDELISNDPKRVMQFDLNVAATEDFPPVELPSENGITSGGSTFKSSSNDSSKQAEKFNFDLNMLGDNADECPRSSFPMKSERLSSFSLNLNEDPWLGGAKSGVHPHIQNGELIGKKKVESAACPVFSKDQDLKLVRLGTGGGMNSSHSFSHYLGLPLLVATPNMQHTVEHIQRMVPLQSKLPYAVQMLPSQSYPSNGPFYVGPVSPIPSSNYYASIVPCSRDTREGVIFPQVLDRGAVSAFPGAPYLVNVPQGQSLSGVMETRTRFDVDSGELYLMNGFRKDNARQFFPLQSTEEQMKIHQQQPLRPMPMKRREPEGGCDSFQPGYKHTTSTR